MHSWKRWRGKGDDTMAEQQPTLFTKPNVVDAIRAVLQEDWDDDVEISRVEIRITASGACPYRLFPSDGSDYIGGVAFAEPQPVE
jgi:hypothetical protein